MTRFAFGLKCGAPSTPGEVPAARSRGSSAPSARPPRPRLAEERKCRRVTASGSSTGAAGRARDAGREGGFMARGEAVVRPGVRREGPGGWPASSGCAARKATSPSYLRGRPFVSSVALGPAAGAIGTALPPPPGPARRGGGRGAARRSARDLEEERVDRRRHRGRVVQGQQRVVGEVGVALELDAVGEVRQVRRVVGGEDA